MYIMHTVGSGGFKVFHPMVFQRVIESLHLVPEYEKSKWTQYVVVTHVITATDCMYTHCMFSVLLVYDSVTQVR